MTVNDEAAADNLGYVETMQRGRPPVVEVFDGPAWPPNHTSPLLVRIAAQPDEHPMDLLRRALTAARRERIRRAHRSTK